MDLSKNEFNSVQFQADTMNLNFSNYDVFQSFYHNICTNINYFARLTKTDSINFFSQYEIEIRKMIRTAMSESFLEHFDLTEKGYSLKKKTNEDNLTEDIYYLTVYLASTPAQIANTDLLKLYNHKPMDNSSLLVKNVPANFIASGATSDSNVPLNSVFTEINHLKTLTKTQSEKIDNLVAIVNNLVQENKNLSTKLNDISTKFTDLAKKQLSTTASLIQPNAPLSKSGNQLNNTPLTPHYSQPMSSLFKNNAPNIKSTNNKPTTSTGNGLTPGSSKRPRQETHPQKTLKAFDSFNPNLKAYNINFNKNQNDGFKLVTSKKQNKFNKKNYNQEYLKSVGQSHLSTLAGVERQFYIYFGKISMTETLESVERCLKNILGNIKFNNLKELNSDKENRSFKSFVFSIGYLSKDIINDKSKWPIYTVVNHYRQPYQQRLAYLEKHKNAPFSTSGYTTKPNATSI